MLNVGQLNEGFVLDHIEAGKSMQIYDNLGLGKLDCQVAIIKNARSNKMGKKDIIKIEGGLDLVDLDVLGFIDHNITVNIIKDGEIVEKSVFRSQNVLLMLSDVRTHAVLHPLSRNWITYSHLPMRIIRCTDAYTARKSI
ncbi:aspartate carbamoyltransferase regulatory chain, allosteric domain protein [[Bacteroides] pectinophilus ATCC 43243]|uniref:Aspartate carbamoyltransferase regulatory subunit N-terminal domain-containing protein n=1 Tax=[Bacteroides] pectinophilus ATCC 43243 TaxID=483218 RepID=B7AT76_9FIRM|nr:aspartate carbamoyltransferase regulatory chain, allosteric domain protein [[Bacteroides] pectinophilus ATCC 43243]